MTVLLLWKKKKKKNTKRKPASAMGVKGGGEEGEIGQDLHVFLLDLQAIYYCISLSQRLAETVTVEIHSTWRFLSALPFPQAKQPPGCPTFEDGDFRKEQLYQFLASEAKVAKLCFLLKWEIVLGDKYYLHTYL